MSGLSLSSAGTNSRVARSRELGATTEGTTSYVGLGGYLSRRVDRGRPSLWRRRWAAVTAAKLVFVVALIGICAVGVLRDGEASPLKPAR